MPQPDFFDRQWVSLFDQPISLNTVIVNANTIDHYAEVSGHITANTKEIINAIASGNAVVYLGAGVSKAAGLPDWREFLQLLEREARQYSPSAARSISTRIDSGEYLVAAEMLQNVLGNRLQDIAHRVFGKASVSTTIHKNIAAIPFSLAITTNYDCLLESAYHYSVPRLTWQNPHDVLQNLRSGIFCVLKLHGDYANRKSVVLSRSHYRDLMHVNESLLNCLRMLLATRTFLFVGVSFSDPDLLALMDEAKSLYGDVFGPHFAVFPEMYFDPEYSQVLERSYNIRTLVARKCDPPHKSSDPITSGVAELVAHLGGLSAYSGRTQPFRHGLAQYLQEPSSQLRPPGERLQASWLLQTLVLRLGVPYGDLCMTDPHMTERRLIYRTMSYSVTDHNVAYVDPLRVPIAKDLVQSRLFLQRKIENDFALITDTRKASHELSEQGFHDVMFQSEHHSTNTALCVPVYVDGRRSGVVTLEADEGFLFSKHHFDVIRDFAGRIGSARYEANRIADSARRLQSYRGDPLAFQNQLRRSRDLDDLELECLLYQIDPYRGKLEAPLRHDEEKSRAGKQVWDYDFEEQSLACEAFRERRTVRVLDAEACVSEGGTVLAVRGRDFFNISGPVCAFPIHVRGYTAGVFVGWSAIAKVVLGKSSISETKQWLKGFWRGMERARRILHLLANEPKDLQTTGAGNGRAMKFFTTISDTLQAFDGGKSWGNRVSDPIFRRKVSDGLLKALIHEPRSKPQNH